MLPVDLKEIVVLLDLLKAVHLHTEAEFAAKIGAIRVYTNLASTLLNDLFDDWESKTYAIVVHVCCSVQFTESRE